MRVMAPTSRIHTLLLGKTPKLKHAQMHPVKEVLDLIPPKNYSAFHLKISFFFLASGPGPLLTRLHPHTPGRVVHHVHQPSGVTAALGPRMCCRLVHGPRGWAQTGRLSGHLLLDPDHGGWRATRVHGTDALEDHPRFDGGFGAMLSHSVT